MHSTSTALEEKYKPPRRCMGVYISFSAYVARLVHHSCAVSRLLRAGVGQRLLQRVEHAGMHVPEHFRLETLGRQPDQTLLGDH